ncbi:MAG: 1-(5-phosphoribosyl)-5-[(5-phosphoribosylamino)methylideneamino] imidazole-4-carboxamide isomerase [Gemmatimonadetes bacterium]|nr:1-(5-phosphoribosyl)-5-[(5-phosphoribosylamino)methylideneamino] imidazole-4-carboxamide isomerase [Gemmatimonadota bacterium]MBK7924473.1 1-(5-phosphoribosyl)-5-[(5-phosphoribosylamino)methylideneamino] imidazole-4-carboxamide isomerase [Gemmatimonadota bacterium]
MELYPAIDVRGGRVVRLSQGEAARETSYGTDPVAQAEQFVADGARWLHVVDLDRAFGTGDNLPVLARLAAALGRQVRIQVGGGLRSLEALRTVLDLGVTRGVLGTAAVTDPALVPQAVAAVGAERVAVGLDTKGGHVAIRGWVETTPLLATIVCRRVVAEGIHTIIYTDVSRDGMLSGPDLDGARALQALGAGVIASGGVASVADLCAAREAGLAGAIAGRAIYEGRFTVAAALAALA